MLPKPYPDEIVGSVLLRGRQHAILPLKPFLAWVFGVNTGRASASFVLGHSLGRIARLSGLSGRAFLQEHTVFSYVAAYRCPAEVEALTARLLGETLPSTVSTASLAHVVTSIAPYRRYCAQCVRADMRKYGEAYWHRLHQLPTTLLCPVHGTPLRVTVIRSRITGTPSELALPSESVVAPACTHAREDVAKSLLWCTHRIVDTQPGERDPAQQHYRHQARTLGYARPSGELASGALSQALAQHYGRRLLAQLHCDLVGAKSQWWPALLLRPGVKEPASVVRHVLLDAFLRFKLAGSVEAVQLPKRNYPCRDYAMLDELSAATVREMLLVQSRMGGDRLTVRELLEYAGVLASYKHLPNNFPLLRAVIQEFRRSSLSQRQLGGREYWRQRTPSRWGLQSKRSSVEVKP